MEKRNWCLPLFWLGLGLLGLVLISSIFWGGRSAIGIERKIETSVQSELNSKGFDQITAKAKGQSVHLTGIVPSDTQKEQISQLARAALGPGGVVSGGVTRVRSDLQVGRIVSPYIWGASVERNDVTLSGYVPSEEVRSKIVTAAKSFGWGNINDTMELGIGLENEAQWTDFTLFALAQLEGLKPGEVSIVDSHLSINGAAQSNAKVDEISSVITKLSSPFTANSTVVGPYNWVAEKRGDEIRLSGLAPDEESKRAILRAVTQNFNGKIIDEMGIGGEYGWARTALVALPHFVNFESGQLSYSDKTFYISGKSPDSVYNFLSDDMSTRSGGFGVQYDIDVAAPDLEELDGIDLNENGENLVGICQDAFALIMDFNQLYFETGRADISRRSGTTLDKLVAVAKRCRDFSIKIEGHTDNLGSRGLNLALSNQRAQAVADYLVQRGLPQDSISSIGYGADRPAASNATPEGRAQNRRIEFLVTSEETR
ncbi:OmpA family protein [Hirschia litorea]|uniref:OmpA family protein n=1 Tax=Hirschia litorea TaxID=1199156 RepID=A0ABW2IHK8_9PROT